MSREQIIQMAREAGAVILRENCLEHPSFPWGCEFEIDQLERFANAVEARAAAHEREQSVAILNGAADAIRARGQQ